MLEENTVILFSDSAVPLATLKVNAHPGGPWVGWTGEHIINIAKSLVDNTTEIMQYIPGKYPLTEWLSSTQSVTFDQVVTFAYIQVH